MFEREIDASLLCEVWEQSENVKHKTEIENMLEMEGLKYFSMNKFYQILIYLLITKLLIRILSG